jgi:NAD(P)-dependent dehydrogenase (short-subunit alcohol dehydrogenase family)
MSSQSKVAVVTGAGSGIGRASALALLKAGYCVTLTGRRKQALEESISAAGSDADHALAVPADISRPDQVKAVFDQTVARFGRVDVLFNNAGTNAPGVLFEDLSYEKWQAVVDTNLTGSFLCAQAAFRIMKDQNPRGGRIINNGSISAHAPRPDSAPYTATKHAITGLTKTIALDGRKYDITCSQIDIGNAMTDLAARMSKGVKQANGTIATEAMMDVNRVGDAVVQMANLPLDTNILFMTIMATKMPFVGRG